MKIGFDFGNKTFTVMRTSYDGIEPIPNIVTSTYGMSQESYPAVFIEQNDEWFIGHQRTEGSKWHLPAVVQAGHEPQETLERALEVIFRTIQQNDPGNAIDKVVYTVPMQDGAFSETLAAFFKAQGMEAEVLDETLAILFGSTLFEQFDVTIGQSKTVLVLDGKVHGLQATVYTATVLQREDGGIQLDLLKRSQKFQPEIAGEQIELMLAAKAKGMAREAGQLDVEAYAQEEWLNFVDTIKAELLYCEDGLLMPNFVFEDGTPWEEPFEFPAEELYAVLDGEPFEQFDGQVVSQQLTNVLEQFIHQLCDEGGIQATAIDSILLAGGTFRLPFWQQVLLARFPKAEIVPLPNHFSEVALAGRGCAKYIEWQEECGFQYEVREQTQQYVGVQLMGDNGPYFQPLLAWQGESTEKSAPLLLAVSADAPFQLPLLKGPQTAQVSECRVVQTVRLYHRTLAKKLGLNHIALYLTKSQNELTYELQHPYTGEVVVRESVAHVN